MTLALAIGALAVAGCGAKYDNVAPPTAPTGSVAADVHDCKPSTQKPKVDLSKIEGQAYGVAEANALKAGYAMRASFIDGKPQAQTMDYSEKRLNVAVNDGNVTTFCGIG
jgi:hypothetical protein